MGGPNQSITRTTKELPHPCLLSPSAGCWGLSRSPSSAAHGLGWETPHPRTVPEEGAEAQAVCAPGEGSSEEGHGGWDLWGDRELASEEEDSVPGKADGLRDRAG